MLRCNKCEAAIDEERIKSFLSTTGELPETCKECSDPGEWYGMMMYHGKVGGDVVALKNPTKEQKRLLRREYIRGR